jgi:CHAT domain-containing protein/Tfp pilus assembly protein PilF
MAVKKYDKSINILARLIESDTCNANAYRKLAEVYYLKNDLNSGLTHFGSLAKENPRNSLITYGRGYLYQRFKENSRAESEYQKIISLIPPYAPFYRDMIDNYEQNKELGQADSIFNNLAANDTNNLYINYGLGYLFMKHGNWKNAISYLDKTVVIADDFLDAYSLKAVIYFRTGQYDKLLEVSKTGLVESKANKDIPNQCVFSGNIGLSFCYTGNYKEAEIYLKKAIKLSEQTGQKQEEVRSYGNLGLVYLHTGDYERSIKISEKAIKGAQQIKDRNREGLFYYNIGLAYQMMGKFDLALDYIKNSLCIAEQAGDKYTKLLCFFNLGLVSWNLGDYDNALTYYNRMHEMAIETGDIFNEGRCYGGIGLIYLHHGFYAKALDFEEKGQAIANEIGDSEGESLTLGNIAIIYQGIGNYTKALEYYTKALDVSEKIGDKSGTARHLGNIGCMHRMLDNCPAALDYFRQSLKINKEIGNQKEIAMITGNIGELMMVMKDYKKAKDYLSQALKTGREIRARYVIENQLFNLGYLEYNQANYVASLDFFSEALKYAKSSSELEVYCQAHRGIAMVLDKLGKPEQALEHYMAAIDKNEKVQHELPVEEYKSYFFGEHIDVYEGIIGLLASMHNQYPQNNYDKLAFKYAERAKARAFLENLIASKADVQSGIDPGLKHKEDEILRKISVNQKQLYNNKLTNRESEKLEGELVELENDFEKLSREIRENNSKYATLFYPESYDAEKIQHEILHDNEVILEFFLGIEHSFLWKLSKDQFKLYQLPEKETIEKAVSEYMNTIEKPVGLTNPFSNHIKTGYDVFEILLQPCINEIKKGSHVIIIPDGILHYLPFESLVIKKCENSETPHYLIEDFTFSYNPSSTSMAYYNADKSKNLSRKQLLAFGNPDYKETPNESITRGWGNHSQKLRIQGERDESDKLKNLYETDGFHFSPLPFSDIEVSAIASLFPKGRSVIHVKSDASEESFKNEALESYRYIHFATHGFIEETAPFRSGIVLSTNDESKEDGILQVNEILNLRLNADMVVLSACQTARGKLYQGEGIVGLARSFFYAGSTSVTVCLWNINDRTTAGFMKDFYSGLVHGMDKNEALQGAKLNMIHSEYGLYRHPYYWAPYIFIGNCR